VTIRVRVKRSDSQLDTYRRVSGFLVRIAGVKGQGATTVAITVSSKVATFRGTRCRR